MAIATSSVEVLRRPLESAQYLSIKYTERLAEAGIAPSVGSVGDSYDNALAETINGLFKTEVIRRCGPWRSVEAVELATLAWVDWFNHRRLLEPIGGIPPAARADRQHAARRGRSALPRRAGGDRLGGVASKRNCLRESQRGSLFRARQCCSHWGTPP